MVPPESHNVAVFVRRGTLDEKYGVRQGFKCLTQPSQRVAFLRVHLIRLLAARDFALAVSVEFS